MTLVPFHEQPIIQRVRAILLTERHTLMFIKRVKPGGLPYWVAPGGGVEEKDTGLLGTLERELCEELGATVEVIRPAFVLRHVKAEKNLEEHFFICHLIYYDIALRNGPEFDDPSRGEFIPYEIPLTEAGINSIEIKTPELRDWLLANLDDLRAVACA